MFYTNFLISKFTNNCIEQEHRQCDRLDVMKNNTRVHGSLGMTANHVKKMTRELLWGLQASLLQTQSLSLPQYLQPWLMVVFNTSPRCISRKAYVQRNRIIGLSSMSEIGWLKWGTDLINFFQCSWESIFSVMCPGHSGEEMTLIKQKKRLFLLRNLFLSTNSSHIFTLIMNIPLEVHGGVPDTGSVREIDNELSDLSWILRNSESHDIDSVLSLPELPGPRMRDELCVHKQRALREPLQWPESQAVLDGWKRSLA